MILQTYEILLKKYNLNNILKVVIQDMPNNEDLHNPIQINLMLFLIIILLLFIFVFLLYFISKYLTINNNDLEKLLPYECGFDIFQKTETMFEIHFYIICLLYITFDIEILIILPFILNLSKLTFMQYYSALGFFFLLILGYLYEYKKKIFNL
jgi:NADH-quinone oxidoreductase subunit A